MTVPVSAYFTNQRRAATERPSVVAVAPTLAPVKPPVLHVTPDNPDLRFKMTPRLAQRKAVSLALSRVGTGFFMSMGYGKSAAAIAVFENGGHKRCLVVCPKAVVPVWPYQFEQHAITVPPILALESGTTADKAEQVAAFGDGVIVVNYASATYGFDGAGKVRGLTKALYQWNPDCLVYDECFVAGTQVLTAHGVKPIESVCCGDIVANAMGWGAVERVFTRPTVQPLVSVEYDDGSSAVCTETHEHFTEVGWVAAGALAVGQGVFCLKEVRALRDRVQAVDSVQAGRDNSLCAARGALEQEAFLLWLLRKEAGEPDTQARGSAKNECDTEAHRAQTEESGRKWEGAYRASAEASRRAGFGVGHGIRSQNLPEAREHLPCMLQSGFGEPGKEDCDRGGRRVAHGISPESARQEERFFSRLTRVVRVSRVESEGPRIVYNLHVAGHPSYFANGRLVHNCHSLKSSTSKQSKMAWDLGRQKFVKRRLGLTGTPFHHMPEDIFGQMRFIDETILGPYVTHFRNRWMYRPLPDKVPNKWLFRPELRSELERVVGAVSITGLTRDAVDLPPVQDIEVPLTLEPQAYRAYQKLKAEFIAELGAGIVTAANAAVKSGKLRQLTGGAVFGEDGAGNVKQLSVPTPKTDALETLLDGIDESERVVAFSSYKFDVLETAKAAANSGRKCFTLNGGCNELKEWYATPGSVLAINIQSGGAGIDLSCASYGVFWNHGVSRGNYEQARARLDRPGQKGQQVTFWHLLCTGTLDVAVYRAMKSGGEVADAMMAAMRDGRK